MKRSRLALLALWILPFCGSPEALAEDRAERFSRRPDAFGTASETALVLGSFLFQPRFGGVITTPTGIDRHSTEPMQTTPFVPNGALLERIELRACDASDTLEVALTASSCPIPGASCSPFGSVSTGIPDVPGCGLFSADVIPPYQVDSTAPLFVSVSTGNSATTTFSAVKLYYRLQVSPAPATATFADVPTDYIYFRAIEALAASGITSGCGGGNYCPDKSVTRGELAKFLANALGLHWPN